MPKKMFNKTRQAIVSRHISFDIHNGNHLIGTCAISKWFKAMCNCLSGRIPAVFTLKSPSLLKAGEK